MRDIAVYMKLSKDLNQPIETLIGDPKEFTKKRRSFEFFYIDKFGNASDALLHEDDDEDDDEDDNDDDNDDDLIR